MSDSDRQASIERAREIRDNRRDADCCNHGECFYPTLPEMAQDVLSLASALAEAERQRDEAREFLGDWDEDGLSLLDLVKRAYGWGNLGWAATGKEQARADAAEAALADTREALRPFRSFAEHAVEHVADAAWSWCNRTGHERICDWFGPSEFGAVLAAGPACQPEEES